MLALDGFSEEVEVDGFVFSSVCVSAEAEVDDGYVVANDDITGCEVSVVYVSVVYGGNGVADVFHDAWIGGEGVGEHGAVDVFHDDGVRLGFVDGWGWLELVEDGRFGLRALFSKSCVDIFVAVCFWCPALYDAVVVASNRGFRPVDYIRHARFKPVMAF